MTAKTVTRRATELLDAAVSEFLANGYAAVGVKEITERAGVSHGTFYNYFDSKRHMLSVLIDRESAALLDTVSAAGRVMGDPVTVAGLRAAIHAATAGVLTEVADRIDEYRFLLFEVPGVDADSFEEYLQLYREAVRRCSGILAPAAEAGLLTSAVTVENIAEGWLGYMTGVVAAMVNDLDVPDPAETARVITNLLLGGAPRAGRPA
ncbi:TetR/AcrR family transcriptional regulator [Tsukamurella sp. 1534]|uniref:TetR/AcrR family transcriptional regulator n=1 Tax=Tsukamurella sp. 1534 TaxID=1151061 RepID=UPI0002EA0200|nr:TetR/AcrR family transcriptional regulator [Tsukamurella sp. 1534]